MKMILKAELLRQLYPDTADGNIQQSETLYLVRKLIEQQTVYDAKAIVYAHWEHFWDDPLTAALHAYCSHCVGRAFKRYDRLTSSEMSAFKDELRADFYAYCPNCGAYMRKGDDNV